MTATQFHIAPSILSADFARLGEEVRQVALAGADMIHIDVMDGHFVPNITIGPLVVRALRRVVDQLPHKPALDVHLMIENPGVYIRDFAEAGSDIITIHAESEPHLHRTLSEIRARYHKRAGLALNPGTSLSCLEELVDYVDMVLIMTVNPGFGGQKFIPGMLSKISRARQMLTLAQNNCIDLQVDGGINVDNIETAKRAGANVFVAGSAIFESSDYFDTIQRMLRVVSE
jgi:ribulose-phosphate 3-epimerase